ncbi:MAG TPA: SAM-dependent methyltransferase [Actinophytocola sp.]|uniref:SAM-dependent methyltransferase n=1 Tax=Actinophytocola sp. TaxID=1872138 RepID=UPI002DBD0561|nr:SAM-dependent methyltransferase [Actinophytocola sp.]HEU5471471.1 SAM-dependent methyltransferase [Actinophytocola sp.]
MESPDWVPNGIDVTVPNAARMYDYALGGYHNFAVDREFVERAEKAIPGATLVAHMNRAFLGRAVRWLAGQGIRQFLDIGSGIPTLGNVHEIALAAAPDARVMYVDLDPVAVAHSRAILAGQPRVGVLEADVRKPQSITDHPDVTELLDFSEPVAVLLVAVLHFVPDDDDPAGILGWLRDAMVGGSYIVLSHGAPVPELGGEVDTLKKLYKQTPTPLHLRSSEQIAHLLSGLDVVEPGIVPISEWHPDPNDGDPAPHQALLAAAGRTR